RKGVSKLLDIFELLLQARTDLRLVLVGDGHEDFVETLRARIRTSADPSQVEIVRGQGREDVLALIQHAGALVLPTAAEGFGLPILEALALGTPVVASDLPSIRSWAGDSIRYALARDTTTWVEPVLDSLDAGDAFRRAGQRLACSHR